MGRDGSVEIKCVETGDPEPDSKQGGNKATGIPDARTNAIANQDTAIRFTRLGNLTLAISRPFYPLANPQPHHKDSPCVSASVENVLVD